MWLGHLSAHGTLLGVSDASIKDKLRRHTWILTTGAQEHISNPDMMITGVRLVGGHVSDMSSARGELQGQTALAIMAKYLTISLNASD
jgi:hypothetical protein